MVRVLKNTVDRRDFVKRSGLALGACMVAGPFGGLTMRGARAQVEGGFSDLIPSPFGPPRPARDLATGLPLLSLPPGFRYQSFGWTGDQLADGLVTPNDHDGMAIVAVNGRRLTLIRNHEITGTSILGGDPEPLFNANGGASVYDPVGGAAGGAGGGCTRLEYDGRRFTTASSALGGTRNNCAGGPTPWGSWMSCEEDGVTLFPGLDHGFVFDVPASGQATGTALTQLGRFSHEAIAVDPRTNAVLLTEDSSPTFSGIYLFVPTNAAEAANGLERPDGSLVDGQFYMLAVDGQPNANLTNPQLGDRFDVAMVPVPTGFAPGQASGPFFVPPQLAAATGLPDVTELFSGPAFLPFATPEGQFSDGQVATDPIMSSAIVGGIRAGGAIFRRGEGAWFANGTFFFADTFGGAAVEGAIWAFTPDPADPTRGVLECLFVSPDAAVGNNVDNITIHPRTGTILACEDGGGLARLTFVLPDGNTFVFAENNIQLSPSDIAGTTDMTGAPRNPDALGVTDQTDFTGQEWAGASFSPDGNTLFVNIQTPGITFAIQGPFLKLLAFRR